MLIGFYSLFIFWGLFKEQHSPERLVSTACQSDPACRVSAPKRSDALDLRSRAELSALQMWNAKHVQTNMRCISYKRNKGKTTY